MSLLVYIIIMVTLSMVNRWEMLQLILSTMYVCETLLQEKSDCLQMLISVASCQVNAVDSDQTTPLAMAAMYGNASTCESLVSTITC